LRGRSRHFLAILAAGLVVAGAVHAAGDALAPRVAPLPEASRPFDESLPREALLRRGRSPVITEFRIGFDTRAVDIVRYLPADPSLGIDSVVLWQTHYDELSDYLADLALSGQDVGWLRELDSMRSFRDSVADLGNRFELPVRIPDWAKRLGVSKPALTLTGSYTLSLRAESHWTNKEEEEGTANRVPDIIPEQIPNIFLTGTIGRLISVTLNWTEEGFGANQSQVLQVRYAGEKPEDTEDDILQEAVFGQIALNLPGSTLTGYNYAATGLIGLMARMRFGDVDLTVVGGAEKGERQRQKIGRGATETRTTFLDNALPNVPRDLFLSYQWRKRWREYALDPNGPGKPENLQLFQRVRGDQISTKPEWKPWYTGSAEVYDSTQRGTGVRTTDNEKWRRLADGDWEWDRGVIRIKSRGTANDEPIGAVWKDGASSFGKVTGSFVDLVLLRDNGADRLPLRQTQLRNRYYRLPSVDVADRPQVQVIVNKRSGGGSAPSVDPRTGKSWAQVFGLVDSAGRVRYDNERVFDWENGALIFPDEEPFRDSARGARGALYDSALAQVVGTTYPPAFEIVVVARGKSDKIQVSNGGTSNVSGGNCIDIREGSEVLTLDGSATLVKGVDYDVSYASGTIYLLSDRAKNPNADIQVDYECTPFFSLETRTVAGARLDWQIPWIGTDSKLGATLLYRSETVTDPRPQLDREPNRAWLWGANMALAGEAEWMTELADKVPLVKPSGDSKWRVELEGAQSWNDPNTEGYALLDDFEAARQEMSFPLNRTGWKQASPPQGTILPATGLAFPEESYKRLGEFVWSSNAQWNLANIYPNHDDGDNAAARQNVLRLRLTPNDHGWGGTSWGGIMRPFSSGTADNSDAKYLEVVVFGTGGVLLFDFGQIDEDLSIAGAAPNGRIDGEDVKDGVATGQGKNDYGLDGLPNALETGVDWSCFGTVCNGVALTSFQGDPARDDYKADNESSDPSRIVNGTEGNNGASGSSTFDTEDLNGNGTLDRVNNFNRYAIRLGGKGRTPFQQLKPGWRLYRIPLSDTAFRAGTGADWTALSAMRVLYTGVVADNGGNSLQDGVQIARMALVGNQWRGGGHMDGNDSVVYLDSAITGSYLQRDSLIYPDSSRMEISVANNRDDASSYRSWDVPASTDANSGAVLTEQSLKLSYHQLRSDFGLPGAQGAVDSGFAVRAFESPRDLTLYDDLILLVYHAARGADHTPVRLGIQYGTGDWQHSENYYEYSFSPEALDCPLSVGGSSCPDPGTREALMGQNWSRNKVRIDLQSLATLKNLRQAANLPKDSVFRRGLDIVPFGDVASRRDSILVKGTPSLSQVDWVRFWVRANPSATGSKSGEIWLNDLRLEHPERSLGTALRASAQTNMADLLDLSASAEYNEGDFVRMGQSRPKLSQQASTVSFATAGRLNLAKFLPEAWGAALPLNARLSAGLHRPWARPGEDVVLTRDGLSEMLSDWWDDDLRRDSADLHARNSKAYQTIDASRGLSTNWSRQRDARDGVVPFLANTFFARPTVAWSWTETGRLAPESRDTSNVQGLQVDYDFSPSATPTYRPFDDMKSAKVRKWMPPFLSNLGLQPWPNKITATLMDLDFTEHQHTTLDPDRDEILARTWDTLHLSPGHDSLVPSSYAIDFERSASVSHSLSSEWQLVDFLRLTGKVGTDRSWTDLDEAGRFNPAHLWEASPLVFALDTTRFGWSSSQRTRQELGILRNENRRTSTWQVDFSPRLLPFLTTGTSYRSSSSANRDAVQPYVERRTIRTPRGDSVDLDTASHQLWRLDQQDGFSANTSLSFTDLLRSLQSIGPDGWDKNLGSVKSVLEKWRFTSVGFNYGVDARVGGVRQTLGHLEQQEGLDQAAWWRWQMGMGDEDSWRSPWDLMTGSRSKSGLGQYEPWRLDDYATYGDGDWYAPKDEGPYQVHVDRSSQSATRAYQLGANTSFTIPNVQLSVSPSWRWTKSWTEYWMDPSNVDTSTTDPSISVNLQLANFADRFSLLKRFFSSAVANHTTTWEKTYVVHPFRITSDEENENFRFQPLLGLNFKTHGNWTFGNDFKWGVGWGWDYEKSARLDTLDVGRGDTVFVGLCPDDAGLPLFYTDKRVSAARCFEIVGKTATRSLEIGDDATATYRLPTKRGIQILRWFLRLDNDLIINFGAGWGYNRKTREIVRVDEPEPDRQKLSENTKVYARSNASYNFTPKLVVEFLAEYHRNESWASSDPDGTKISYQILAQAQLRYNF